MAVAKEPMSTSAIIDKSCELAVLSTALIAVSTFGNKIITSKSGQLRKFFGPVVALVGSHELSHRVNPLVQTVYVHSNSPRLSAQ